MDCSPPPTPFPHFRLENVMPSYSRCIYILPNALEEKNEVHLVYEYGSAGGGGGGGGGSIHHHMHLYARACIVFCTHLMLPGNFVKL